MAPAYSRDAEPDTADGAMFFNCLARIGRTAREKTATRPQQRADEEGVETDQACQKFLHLETFLQCRPSEFIRTRPLDISILVCGSTTRSSPASSAVFFRKLSRIILFTLLRATAFLSFPFATASPRRGYPRPFSLARTRNWESAERTLVLKTLWNSEGLFNR